MDLIECKKYCFTPTGKIKRKNLIPCEVKKYLFAKLYFCDSLEECLYRLKNNDYNIHYCPVCHKKLKYVLSKNRFQNHCSPSCATKDIKVRMKANETLEKRYGKKYKEIIYKKGEETRLRKYGSKSFLGTKECIEKSQQTKLRKYGDKNYNNKEKQAIAQKKAYKTTNLSEKIKSTMLKRYGVEYFLSSEVINSIRNNKDIQNKIINTKRKNNTFKASKMEEELYKYIAEKFPNVKRQYKDDIRYPFACDFYIPELDTFIELNGIWTHGRHPYSQYSEEDKKILQKWKSKKSKFYDNAIKNWTIRDVEKRNKAKENNLNYKEVWSLEEGKTFIDFLYCNKCVSTISDECKKVGSGISTDSKRKATECG